LTNFVRPSPGTGAGYDANGNATAIPGTTNETFTYDGENRVATANANGTITYVYDGEGRRVSKAASTFTTNYLYDAFGKVVQETTIPVTGTSYPTQAPFTGTEYPIRDHLGSTRVSLNSQGQVVRRWDFLPFGEEIVAGVGGRGADYEPSNSVYPATPDAVLRKFTGKERDAETGLDYFGARYFSAAQGRFTSPDWSTNPQPAPYASLTDPQTLNLYGYVRNSPMARADADGHCFWDLCIGEGIATYAAATAVVATAAYLMTPQGKESLRAAVVGTGALINKAAEGVQSLITKSEAKPGTLGKPDHQQTVQEEAAKIGGKPEVTIKTPGGTKDARRADAAKKDAAGNITDVTQVYRPTPAGNIPKREVDAARDIENATGVKPTMVPVRPVTPPKPNSEVE
jgi:RHS repeat-associated protein